jgi:hypothetical protein
MSYKPDYDYDKDAFIADWDAYARATEGKSYSDYSPKKHFSQKYSDPKEALYKLRRFAAMISYLQNHPQLLMEFSDGDEHKALVTLPLLTSLWRYYGAIPDQHIRDEPEQELILRMAREEHMHS